MCRLWKWRNRIICINTNGFIFYTWHKAIFNEFTIELLIFFSSWWVFGQYFFSVLLRYNSHTALYKFKVCSVMTDMYREMVTTASFSYHPSPHIGTKKGAGRNVFTLWWKWWSIYNCISTIKIYPFLIWLPGRPYYPCYFASANP